MRWILRALVLGALAVVLVWANRNLDLTWSGIVGGSRDLIEPLGALGPVLFIGFCIVGVIAHAPEIVLIAVGGVLFGAFWGFVYGWIGAIAGSTSSFLIARYLFRDALQRSVVARFPSIRRLDARLERHGFVTMLVLRIVLFMAPPLNWALGATRVRFRDYLAGSALGIVPVLALTVYLADTITTAESAGALVRDPHVIVPTLLVVGLSLGSVLLGRRLFGGTAPVAEAASTRIDSLHEGGPR